MPARVVERERTVSGDLFWFCRERAHEDDWFDLWIDMSVLPAVRAHKKILQRLQERRDDARARRRLRTLEA
jgi:hypothetical protein